MSFYFYLYTRKSENECSYYFLNVEPASVCSLSSAAPGLRCGLGSSLVAERPGRARYGAQALVLVASLVRSMGPRAQAPVFVARGPGCSKARGIFPDWWPKPCPLHGQVGPFTAGPPGKSCVEFFKHRHLMGMKSPASSGVLKKQLAPDFLLTCRKARHSHPQTSCSSLEA